MAGSSGPKEDPTVLVENVTVASKSLEMAKTNDVAALARRNLLIEAKKLVASLEDPSTEVWPRAFQVNVAVAVDVAWNLGVWQKLKDNGVITLAEIIQSTGAEEIMISKCISDCATMSGHETLTRSNVVRIFRQLTAAGVLADVSGPGYALTPLGKPYLDPNHCAFNRFLLKEVIPSIMAMPHTLRERGYKAPTRESGTPFKWANGEELWTFLGSHPARAMDMVNGMKSLNTGSLAGDAYPFAEELGKLTLGAKEDEVAIVDVAGGQGHIMEEVRRLNPSIKGRFIVQDLASTFEAVSGPPPGVEFMPHDMFTPQPIKDAYVYYYRHIIHDWNDQDVSRFLQPVVDVLREQRRPGARLLLVDLVLPNDNVGMQEAVRDFSMFPIGGLERNERQWRDLLAQNSLRIKKIWRGSEPEACVECELDTV